LKYKYKVFFIIVPLLIILDQVTKLLIAKYIPVGGSVTIIPNFFDLVHTYNTGAAFGMFAQVDSSFRVPFFYGISIFVGIALIIYFIKMSDTDHLMIWTISFIYGGMIGNLIDRIRLGHVLDFASAHIGDKVFSFTLFGKGFDIPLIWPAFNVADSAITAAIFMLLIGSFYYGSKGKGDA